MQRLPKETRRQRREREKLQRQTVKPSPPSRAWLFLKQVPKAFYGAICVVAVFVGLLGLLVLYPWLSLEQGERLRPTDPFGIMLNISNEGFLPLRDVSISCGLDFTMTDGLSFKNVSVQYDHFAESLPFKHKLSLPCHRAAKVFTEIAEVHLHVIVSYNIWRLPGRRNQDFLLTGVKDIHNDWHWLFVN